MTGSPLTYYAGRIPDQMKNIYLQLFEYQTDKSSPVLATVIRTKGSSPQKPGSSALYNEEGLLAGTVGGGVVEGRIGEMAVQRVLTRRSGYYDFDLFNDISKKSEPICGGNITILIDANPLKHGEALAALSASIASDKPGILLTLVSDINEREASVSRYWLDEDLQSSAPDHVYQKALPVAREMLSISDPSDFREVSLSEILPGSYMFLESVLPPLKLVIAGAGHIGRALSHIGNMLGFEVTVIDDREEYANKENIPDASRFIVMDPGEAARSLEKRQDTYVVIVSRGHKDDAEVLKACIGSDLAYLGMIGSRRKIGAVRDEFMSKGWATHEQWEKLHTPIGMEINAQTVEEIAVSIAAELIMVKNNRKGKKPGCPA